MGDPRAPLISADLYLGRLCTWLHVPRGGYGYALPIDARVIAVSGERAQIQIAKRDGTPVLRWVKVASLRNANATAGALAGADYHARHGGSR